MGAWPESSEQQQLGTGSLGIQGDSRAVSLCAEPYPTVSSAMPSRELPFPGLGTPFPCEFQSPTPKVRVSSVTRPQI